VSADPLVLSAEVDRATARLLDTVRGLPDLNAPSLCEGWTRGHVLSHVSRNADAYANLCTWARTGVETPMYASPAARTADIDAGASRPLDAQLADLTSSHARFRAAVEEMPASAWSYEVRFASGRTGPAALVMWWRLCEVEVHHVDLAAGYGPADWPESFTKRLLHELTVPDGVSGPDHAVAAYLIGRSDGSSLTGTLPAVSKWK
jgi:maleylpyruvate isomerase